MKRTLALQARFGHFWGLGFTNTLSSELNGNDD